VIGRVRGRNGYRVLSPQAREKELLLSAGGHCVPLAGTSLVHPGAGSTDTRCKGSTFPLLLAYAS
jgi:hypothetical protein